MSAPMQITSETRIHALLEAYPTLEDVLMAHSPAWRTLKNPDIRKTAAKITTLGLVAKIEGLDVRELVDALRAAIGLLPTLAETSQSTQESLPADAPAWVVDGEVYVTFDADDYLARGEHPLAHVGIAARDLAVGQMIQLASSFRPAPLLEKMQAQGFRVFCAQQKENAYVTYIGAQP